MRPDLEDYTDVDDNLAAPRSRAMSWVVLAVAVGGFAALAYYAYHAGTQTASNGEVMTVEADKTPIKEAPADAGGEQFPNKDKTIYDVIAPADGDKKGEKMLPDAEHPIAATNTEDSEDDAPVSTANDSTTTFVANNDKKADPVDAANAVKPAATVKSTSSVSANATQATAAPVASVITPSATQTAATTTHSYDSPQMINEKPAPKKDADNKPTPTKAAAATKPVKAAAAKPTAGGSYAVQLGAFKSEDEANASWKKIAAKFPDTIKGSPTIVKAEVNGTTFYRLRATGFGSMDSSKQACATLATKKQACFPVGK